MTRPITLPEDDKDRGTGRTTRQMIDAPHGAHEKSGDGAWFAALDGIERQVLNGLPFYWPDASGVIVKPYRRRAP